MVAGPEKHLIGEILFLGLIKHDIHNFIKVVFGATAGWNAFQQSILQNVKWQKNVFLSKIAFGIMLNLILKPIKKKKKKT